MFRCHRTRDGQAGSHRGAVLSVLFSAWRSGGRGNLAVRTRGRFLRKRPPGPRGALKDTLPVAKRISITEETQEFIHQQIL